MSVTESPVSSTNLRPFLALGIAILAVSSGSIFIRYAQGEGASSLVIAMWRVALATLVLTPFVLRRYRPVLAALRPGQIALAALSGFFLALHFATWITSLEYTSVLVSVTLVNTNPLFVALIAPFVLRERITRRKLMVIGLAIVGGVIISVAGGTGAAPRQDAPLLGIGLALAGAVTVAGYFLIGRQLRATIPAVPYIWLTYGTAALTLLGMVALSGLPIAGLSVGAYGWMTLVGVFPQLIGHSLLNYALGFLSASFVSLAILGEPVIGSILAFFLFKEQFVALQVVGSGLVLAALVLAAREERRAGQA